MILGAILAFLAVTEANIDFVKVGRLAHPDAIPKSWKEGTHKVAAPVKDMPTTYLVIDEFVGSSTCGGTSKLQSGTGFGVCMGTSETSSTKYVTSSKSGYYTMEMYSTSDCTGTPYSYDSPIPTYCLPSGNNGYKYSVVNSTAPWKSVTLEGTVGEIFYDQNSCSQGGSGPVYSWFSTDYCMASTGDDGSAQSTLYSSCDGSTITYTQFSDAACTTQLKTASFPVYTCTASDDKTEYVTRECTSKK